MDNNTETNKIKKIYDNLTYFDLYGSSLVLFIFITILLILIILGCYAFININYVKNDWVNQRCKPYIIPIAGLINKPPGVSVKDYTAQNFNYCSQTILKSITGNAVEPINFTTKAMTSAVSGLENALNKIRPMFVKTRNFFKVFGEDVMGRSLNIVAPLQQIVIVFKDFIGKVLGTMTTSLFTALASFMTLKSTFGVMAKFIVMALIFLSVLIAVFWAIPFTFGSAIAATAIYVAAAIPMAIVLVFMSKILNINPGVKIPSIKCFDKNTEFTMNNGNIKKISELKLGDKLLNNSMVTTIIIVDTKNSVLYDLNGIIVSDSHLVKFNNNWIRVEEHPQSLKINDYTEPYLYCINTDNKVIELNGEIFSDWDELLDDDIDKIKNIRLKNLKYNFIINSTINKENDIIIENIDIHKYLNGGFQENTMIKLKNGLVKKIKNINIGDILENGEKVYGCVEIYGTNLIEQAIYNLGKNKFIQGGGNINICDKTINFTSTLDLDERNKKLMTVFDNKLYHLLTNTKTFFINGIKFYDYNSCIDLFLEKYRGKLLSMKYV
jgi:hypothetical protein